MKPPATASTVTGFAKDSGYRAIHARFARYVAAIYAAAAVIGVGTLVAALVSDLRFQQASARQNVLVDTKLRAGYLGRHLALLAEEVQRLSERPEMNLLDTELDPERRLLSGSHDNSTVFNRGIALLDRTGARVWAAPDAFLRDHLRPIPDSVLQQMYRQDTPTLLAGAASGPEEAVLYVAMAIRQQDRISGILLGAVDLVDAEAVGAPSARRNGSEVVLATRNGQLLFSSHDRSDVQLAGFIGQRASNQLSLLEDAEFDRPVVVASAAVPSTTFVLLTVVDAAALDAPARRRLINRLAVGVTLAVLPLIGLSLMLHRSLRAFRAAEDEAITAERMQSLGEAASLIAHELRNALNSLRLGLDVVLRGESDARGGRRAELLNGLHGEIQRLSAFTTELLTFSRGVVPNLRPLELGRFAERVVEAMRPTGGEREIDLTVHVEGAPLSVRADAGQIHVVLSNLIGNALHFAGHTGPAMVRVEAARTHGACVVRVVDNGPGVAPHVQRRLFEPFVTGRSNGIGIGLALSRRIARAHHGELRQVRHSDGTCFELVLPEAS